MKTLNFLNRKGGVGKTVVAANIAYELARTGYLILIIDLDSQCDITEFFIKPEAKKTSELNIRNVLQNDCTIDEAAIEVTDNLYLVPGSPDLENFTHKYSQKALRDRLQSDALKEVDFVIIDNPPSINQAVKCGLVASDYVVIVSEAENPAMNNLQKVNRHIEDVQKKLNPNLSVLGIAVNKVDQRRNLTEQIMKEMKRQCGTLMFDTHISIDTSIPNSLNQKIAVRELPWRSRTVTQFQNLLNEILFRIEEKEALNEQAE